MSLARSIDRLTVDMSHERPFHLDPTWGAQDIRLSSLESLLVALRQRDLSEDQLDRLALILERGRRYCVAQARLRRMRQR